jgi:hypothetical protein
MNMVHGNLQWWDVVRTGKKIWAPQIRLVDHLNYCHLLLNQQVPWSPLSQRTHGDTKDTQEKIPVIMSANSEKKSTAGRATT